MKSRDQSVAIRFAIHLIVWGENRHAFNREEGISKAEEEAMDRRARQHSGDPFVFAAGDRSAHGLYRHRPARDHHGGVFR